MVTQIITWLIVAVSITTIAAVLGLVVTSLFPSPLRPVSKWPTISVVVPFFNEEPDLLLRSLQTLAEQDYPSPLQVIVVDDGSTNGTTSVVSDWLKDRKNYSLIVLPSNTGRKGLALDHVLQLNIIDGDALLVVDSDTTVDANCLRELAAKLESDPRLAAVCGHLRPANPAASWVTRLQLYEQGVFLRAIRIAEDRFGIVPVLAGALVMHRMAAVDQLGGWGAWLVEDIAWGWKAIGNGYRTGYTSLATATTQCPVTYRQLARQRRRWARGQIEALREAWRTSPKAGMLLSGWLGLSIAQAVTPIAIGLALAGTWWPMAWFGATWIVFFLALLIYEFQRTNGKPKIREALFGVATVALLAVLIWGPVIAGYLDELTGKQKSWLTR